MTSQIDVLTPLLELTLAPADDVSFDESPTFARISVINDYFNTSSDIFNAGISYGSPSDGETPSAIELSSRSVDPHDTFREMSESLIPLFDQIIGNGADNRLIGTNGNDVIRGRGGNDMLEGLSGNDSLVGGLGSDVLVGGKGHDLLEDTYGDNDVLMGGNGRDLLSDRSGSNNLLKGGNGKDQIYFTGFNSRVYGGKGSDWIQVVGDGNKVKAGNGNDRIYALGGDNGGVNKVTGGEGKDIFGFGLGNPANVDDGHVVITDFEPDQDSFEIIGVRFLFDDLNIRQSGSDILMSVGDDMLVVVKNTDKDSLSARNFPNLVYDDLTQGGNAQPLGTQRLSIDTLSENLSCGFAPCLVHPSTVDGRRPDSGMVGSSAFDPLASDRLAEIMSMPLALPPQI